LSGQREYRSWTAEQKIAIVLAGLRGDRSVKEVCREHRISDTLYHSWRDKLIEGGLEALAVKGGSAASPYPRAIAGGAWGLDPGNTS
jgi:transposase-like protein